MDISDIPTPVEADPLETLELKANQDVAAAYTNRASEGHSVIWFFCRSGLYDADGPCIDCLKRGSKDDGLCDNCFNHFHPDFWEFRAHQRCWFFKHHPRGIEILKKTRQLAHEYRRLANPKSRHIAPSLFLRGMWKVCVKRCGILVHLWVYFYHWECFSCC